MIKQLTMVDKVISAREYIAEQLKLGHSLARLTLERVALAEGVVSVLATPSSDIAALENFSQGGIGSSDDTINWLADYISHFLVNPHAVAVFEHSLANRSDAWLRSYSYRSCVRFYDNEVYHWLDSRKRSSDTVLAMIRHSGNYPLLGFLADFKPNERVVRRHRLIGEDLVTLTRNLAVIVVGAFDGEGFLLWSPGTLPLVETV